MASIKRINERKFKITISNGYRADGRKISKAKTITIPDTVPRKQIEQYVNHVAVELERVFKTGYAEYGEMSFEEYSRHWLSRQLKYSQGTKESYRRILEKVYPYIGDIAIAKLRPLALENMLAELRKMQHHGKPIKESTVQKYLTVVSAVLSDAKRNEIIQKNPEEKVEYVLVSEYGPDHDKAFEVEVCLNSNVIGKGMGHSKKAAEQQAAKEALSLMGYGKA